MKIKAIVKLNVDIEEFIKVEGLNENSTHIDIVRVVENYIDEINKRTFYTVDEEEEYKFVQGIKKYFKYKRLKHLIN